MLLKSEIEIPEDMTAGELHDRMSLLGAETLIQTIKKLEEGTLNPVPQDEGQATLAPRITKETGKIDWSSHARDIHNLVRGTTPWPGAYTFIEGKRVRIWRSAVLDLAGDTGDQAFPGTITGLDQESMRISTGKGVLEVFEIQVESGKRMTPYQYALGHDELRTGMKLT